MANEFTISAFIQSELAKRNQPSVPAVEAAKWLDRAGLLKDSAIRPGLPLRKLLRGQKIEGQHQEPNGRWFIDRVDGTSTSHPSVATSRKVMPAKIEPALRRKSKKAEAATPAPEQALKRFAEARAKYKPREVRCVLVAEAPPKAESGRFFYFEDVAEGDSLFWETMKTLYPDNCPQSGPPRHRKREFLERFKADGFYLIDAVEEPLGKVSSTVKRQRIRESLPRLQQDLRDVCGPKTSIILISAPVHAVCADPLRAEGFNVINREMIDFPGSGCQKKFREKFGKLLPELNP